MQSNFSVRRVLHIPKASEEIYRKIFNFLTQLLVFKVVSVTQIRCFQFSADSGLLFITRISAYIVIPKLQMRGRFLSSGLIFLSLSFYISRNAWLDVERIIRCAKGFLRQLE